MVQIYFIFKNKITILRISLHFSVFSSKFSLLDRDPNLHIESGSRKEIECGSMRTRIHSPGDGEIWKITTDQCHRRGKIISWKGVGYQIVIWNKKIRKVEMDYHVM